MAQTSRACQDCGVVVLREQKTGPIPKRCPPCRDSQSRPSRRRGPSDAEYECLVCGARWCNLASYNGGGGRKTSCSESCRYELTNIRAKARYAKRDKPAPKPCPGCGEMFQPSTHHPLYKCEACSKHRRSRPAGTVIEVRNCRWCGKAFDLTNATDGRKVSCSKFCTDAFSQWKFGSVSCKVPQPKVPQPKRPALRGKTLYVCACSWCGRPFLAAKQAKGCSHFCRRARAGAKTDLYRKSCDGCGDEFVTRFESSTWCSRGCSKAGHRFPVSPKRRMKLYVRDGWRCQICSDLVDLDDFRFVVGRDGGEHFVAGPLYPSLDHIVPKSKGGGHESSNLRTAHCKCNSERGAEWQPKQLSLSVA